VLIKLHSLLQRVIGALVLYGGASHNLSKPVVPGSNPGGLTQSSCGVVRPIKIGDFEDPKTPFLGQSSRIFEMVIFEDAFKNIRGLGFKLRKATTLSAWKSRREHEGRQNADGVGTFAGVHA
jgi:hypothetical protein